MTQPKRSGSGRRAALRAGAIALVCLHALPSLPLAQSDARAPTDFIHRIPDPIAHAKQRIEQTCLNVEYDAAFSRGIDLNADGLEDMVIKDIVVCDGYSNVFCGVGGCSGAVYVALPGGGYMLTDLPPNVSTTVAKGRPAVRASGGGRTGVFVWLGDRFVLENEVGRRRITAASAYGAAAVAAAQDAETETFASFDRLSPVAGASAGGAEVGKWFFAEEPSGGARAIVRGADGESALSLACLAGRPQFDLALRPTRNAADFLPYDENVRIDVNAIARGRVIARLSLDYSESTDIWRVAIPSRGSLTAALEGGTEITFRQDGALDRIGRFSLQGSSRAIGAVRELCRI